MTMIKASPLPRSFSLRAAYLLPMHEPASLDGYVTIHDGQITGLGKTNLIQPLFDLGDVILMPGLVNSHTHLEFSNLENPFPAGTSFPEWIQAVVSWRRAQRAPDQATEDNLAPVRLAVSKGAQESIMAGVTSVGEISTVSHSESWYQRPDMHTVLFREILGLSSDDIPGHLETASNHCETVLPAGNQPTMGISPHAPYSLHHKLFQQVCQLAARKRVPCAFHPAESPEELELLQSGTGVLRDFLESLGAWNPEAIPRGLTPLDYLQWIQQVPRSLIIHGNFLSPNEYQFMGRHADRMSLVYCPRTYQHFHETPYPLEAILDHGVHVALGTDSRASNPDLNLLADIQHTARTHPSVAPATILAMGTCQGAEALGIANLVGSIEVGKQADFITIGCRPGQLKHLADIVTEKGTTVRDVMRAGRWLTSPTRHEH